MSIRGLMCILSCPLVLVHAASDSQCPTQTLAQFFLPPQVPCRTGLCTPGLIRQTVGICSVPRSGSGQEKGHAPLKGHAHPGWQGRDDTRQGEEESWIPVTQDPQLGLWVIGSVGLIRTSKGSPRNAESQTQGRERALLWLSTSTWHTEALGVRGPWCPDPEPGCQTRNSRWR